MAKPNLTAQRLRELVHYDPSTGIFTRKVNFGKRFKAGSEAGFVAYGTGYISLSINYTHYLGHRLAWLYMTGEWPLNQIDHIDRCRTNNCWGNLRAATNKQNSENTSQSKGSSGVRGVYFWKARNKWVARIQHHGKSISLGHHETLELATSARKAGEALYFTHIN